MRIIQSLAVASIFFMSVTTVCAQVRDAKCDAPVNMVILSIVYDVDRYQAYRASLAELPTLQNFGGRVIALGTRLEAEPEMLEGDWPEDRHSFVIQFPCEAAAHKFWNSDAYQKIHLPLRVGAGQFNVALFPAIPLFD